MTTLISMYEEGKRRARRCDSRCHNAKSDKCVCVCTGINHQAGLEKAIANTRSIAESLKNNFIGVKLAKDVETTQLAILT